MRSAGRAADSCPQRAMPPLLSLLMVMCVARSASAALTLVNVPTGITTVPFGGHVAQQIDCDVLPQTRLLRVEMSVADANGNAVAGIVAPQLVQFTNDRSGSNATVHAQRAVELFGRREGRFYLSFRLTGDPADVAHYQLSARSSVLSVTGPGQGWQGIWYELVFNLTLFVAGALFFAWRRLHRLDLPFWQRHRAGLFERANFDDLPQTAFEKRYADVLADSLRARAARFWAVPCHGPYVCNTSGIPAALLLRFHLDAAHLCAALAFFSLAGLLPVNYLSGNSRTALPGNSFQQTTISNVPLHSSWYWAHVAYCYLVAALVLAFLLRQHAVLSTLRRRTKRIVGGRSILIHDGLPPFTTKKRLRALLSELYPRGVDDITIVHDFSTLHELLDRRRALAAKLDRMRALDAGFEHGMLSCSLLWCPGSVMLPSPTQTLCAALMCRPCRFYYRHATCCLPSSSTSSSSAIKLTYSKVSSDREIVDTRLADEIDALDEELDFFPEEAIDMYDKRQCVGAAFVIFDSTETRNDFVQLVRAQSCTGRLVNTVEDRAYRLRYGKPRPPCRRSIRSTAMFGTKPPESTHATPLAAALPQPRIPLDDESSGAVVSYLAKLVLTSAPEPDDVIWKNLRYEPLSLRRIVSFLARQVTTTALLLLFSTPTAVLVYIKLDSTSGIYRDLYAEHSVLISLVASYLPSLLLIVVNWCLLAFLYHVTMTEESISESRRNKSFLVKGFIYLVVSSVFLPSIGVTAAYLAFSEIGHQRKSYVESFLYKISSTFFISYICQRTFLGSIVELTRVAERLAYQPWLLGRSVTPEERREASQPWPYYYGHDYAMLLSVFLVILLGTVVTPILTPFGALFFYVKFATVKYNFLYVVPYTPGRGHIAQTAYTIAFVCLVLFELVMAFVLLQIAGRRQFVVMLVLLGTTGGFYFLRLADVSTRVKETMSAQRADALAHDAGAGKTYQSPRAAPPHARRTVLSPSPSNLEQDLGLVEAYTDPYKVALSIYKLLGVNEFHRMSSARTQLKYAFHRLQHNMRVARRREGSSPRSSVRSSRRHRPGSSSSSLPSHLSASAHAPRSAVIDDRSGSPRTPRSDASTRAVV